VEHVKDPRISLAENKVGLKGSPNKKKTFYK
jgi:hypothetical protein